VGIPVAGIVNQRLADRLTRFTGDARVVTYYVERQSGVRWVGGRRRATTPISWRESRLIRNFLKGIDKLTGLPFEYVRSKEEAVMDIYSLKRYFDPSVIGSTYFTQDGYDVTWQNMKRGRVGMEERVTIKHEILHVLGLDHPYGDGFNYGYDTSDTLMSYFTRRGFDSLTGSDRAALVSLWGTESPVS
jgi:hypothetical protein